MRILLTVIAILVALVMSCFNPVLADCSSMTDEKIIQNIILQSIAIIRVVVLVLINEPVTVFDAEN